MTYQPAKCDKCGVQLSDESGLMSAPTKRACGCECMHFYVKLCPEHLLRKIEKQRRGPLSIEADTITRGIDEKY
jgi:hypothetical protein